MIKKILTLTLSAACLLGTFAGCESDNRQADVEKKFWEENPEIAEEVKEKTETVCKEYAAIHLFAQKNNIEISDEDNSQVDSYIEQLIEQKGGQEEFEKFLTDSYLDEELLRSIINTELLKNKSFAELCTDTIDESITVDKILEFLNNKEESQAVNVKHILIFTPEGEKLINPNFDTSTDDQTSSDQENTNPEQTAEYSRAIAEEISEKVKAGEDFDTLINDYIRDENPKIISESFYLVDGMIAPQYSQIMESFKSAAYSLEIDEISDIVETSYGYHIIKRYTFDEEFYETNKVDINTLYNSYVCNKEFTNLLDSLEPEYTEDYEDITITNIDEFTGDTMFTIDGISIPTKLYRYFLLKFANETLPEETTTTSDTTLGQPTDTQETSDETQESNTESTSSDTSATEE